MDKSARRAKGALGTMKVKAGVKAGGMNVQRNRRPMTLKVRAGIKAGGFNVQHNRRLARA